MDLRPFMDNLTRLGELRLVNGADWNLEIGTLTQMCDEKMGPALLFDQIKGYPPGYRVVSNLISTPKRLAAALGFPTDIPNVELVRLVKDKFNSLKPIAPVNVETGPLQENVFEEGDIDLLRLPAPKWHEEDGGRYLGTADMVIMKDPQGGWVNVGTYRMQVHDRQTLGLYLSPGKHGSLIRKSYWSKGKPCPMAVVFGAHPLVWLPAMTAFPWGVEEWNVAGGLLGQPLSLVTGEYTGLPIPAYSEIAIEGECPPPEVEARDEGPFGEWSGYYGSGLAGKEAVVRVKKLLYRNNPVITGAPPLKPPANSAPTYLIRSANLWFELERLGIPGIKGVWFMRAGGSRYLAVVSIEQKYGGHAKQAAMATMAGTEGGFQGRFVIVVDDDIDPSNDDDVLWAMATRCDPATSIEVITKCWSTPMDPVIPPEQRARDDYTNSRAIIMACRPWYWRKDFPRVNTASEQLRSQARKNWPELFPT